MYSLYLNYIYIYHECMTNVGRCSIYGPPMMYFDSSLGVLFVTCRSSVSDLHSTGEAFIGIRDPQKMFHVILVVTSTSHPGRLTRGYTPKSRNCPKGVKILNFPTMVSYGFYYYTRLTPKGSRRSGGETSSIKLGRKCSNFTSMTSSEK